MRSKLLRFFVKGSFILLFFATKVPFSYAFSQASISMDQKNHLLKCIADALQKNAFALGVQFERWDSIIEGYLPSLSEATSEDEFLETVNDALVQFNIGHLYLEKQQTLCEDIINQQIKNFEWAPYQENFLITRIDKKGSPDLDGLNENDLILQDSFCLDRIKLDPKRGGIIWNLRKKDEKNREKEISILLANKMNGSNLKSILLKQKNNTFYLKIPSFSYSYQPSKINEFFKKMQHAEEIILDLRGNRGGYEENLLHFASKALPFEYTLGTLVSKKDPFVSEGKPPLNLEERSSYQTYHTLKTPKENTPLFKGKWKVLINSQTASAAEIIAQALREAYGAAKVRIEGEASAGEVLQSKYVLIGKYALCLPISDYISAGGLRLQGNGIKPDI